MAKFDPIFDPVDDATINALELKLNVRLPAEYRQFLKTVNGCVVRSPVAVHYMDGDSELATKVDYMFGIGNDLPRDITRECGSYDVQKRIPVGFIPIARGGGPQYICLYLPERKDHADYGRLYMWAPELPWDDEEDHTWDYLFPLKESLSDLLAAFRE